MADTLYAAPVLPGGAGAARPPATRADKVLVGRVHLARGRRPAHPGQAIFRAAKDATPRRTPSTGTDPIA